MTAAMLDVMRRRSSFAYIIFGGITVLLALSAGPGSPGCGRRMTQRAWAARVNGETIFPQEYTSSLGQRLQMLQRLADEHGGQFDLQMAERLGLRRYVIEQLIERRLMGQAARGMGLRVNDDELLTYLDQQYGVHEVSFDQYKSWVNQRFALSVDRFEEVARNDAASVRLAGVVRESVTLSEAELRQLYQREHDRLRFDYVRFDVDIEHAAAPGKKEIAELIEKDASALDDAYSSELLRWRISEGAHIRHILLELPVDAPEADVMAARSRLIALRDQATQGADFGQLATENTQDANTRDKGGDLGMVERGTLNPALDAVAFALSPGNIAPEPVRTPEGLHLVQLLEQREASRQPLDEVREDVAGFVLKRRAAALAAETRAKAFLAQLRGGKALATLTVPEDDDELGDVLQSRDPVAASAARKAAAEARAARAKTGRPKLRESSWVLATDEDLPRIGEAPELKDALFAQADGDRLVRQVFHINNAYYVATIAEREHPNMDEYPDHREALRSEALGDKRRRIFATWLSQLRSVARVEVNPALVNTPLVAPGQQAS